MKKGIKKMTTEKKFLLGEAIFILGVFVYLFFSTIPTQVTPFAGMIISDPHFVFEIENGEEIWLSVNEDFSSPIILGEGSDIVLPPGTYYWKVKGFLRESEVKVFTVESQTALDLKERGDNYELENAGNVDLEVERKEEGATITTFSLNIGDEVEVEKDDSTYEGSQK